MSESQPFRYYLRVRYGECDAQKVVFNARYGEYVDLACAEYFRALGFGAEMVSGELDFQLVKQTTEWKAPLRYDDVAEISVRTLKLGNTSFTLGFEIRLAGKPEITSTCETVYVLVDHKLGKRTIPDDVRAKFQQGAVGEVADHAGYL